MQQRRLLSALCFASAALFSSSSWAATTATVDPSHGDVLVNRGNGFDQIKRPVKVKVGNSVMVGPGSSAVIAYNDGCTVNVEPGTVKTVAPISPCASGSSAATDPSYAQNQGNWCWDNTTNSYNNACVFWPVWGAGVGFIIYEIVASP